jgi:hypothetical protein
LIAIEKLKHHFTSIHWQTAHQQVVGRFELYTKKHRRAVHGQTRGQSERGEREEIKREETNAEIKREDARRDNKINGEINQQKIELGVCLVCVHDGNQSGMYMYVYVCVCVYVYVHVYVCACGCVCVRVSVFILSTGRQP